MQEPLFCTTTVSSRAVSRETEAGSELIPSSHLSSCFCFLTREALSGTLPPSRTVDENTSVVAFPLLLVMHHTVRPYLLALRVLLPASSWYIISSAAGTGFFWCQLKAQLLKKNKTWPILSIICSHQDLDPTFWHRSHDHFGHLFQSREPSVPLVSNHIFPTYSTGSFQPSKLWVAFGQPMASYQCFAWFSGNFFNLVIFFPLFLQCLL